MQQYIANSTGGDPETLVQMTIFRMVPWEHDACTRLPTRAERASYRQWVRRAATGIGDAHVGADPAAGRAVRALRAGWLDRCRRG